MAREINTELLDAKIEKAQANLVKAKHRYDAVAATLKPGFSYTHDEVGNFTPSVSYISICLLRSSPILGEWLASSKYSITSSLSSN